MINISRFTIPYNLETPEERVEYVNKICETFSDLTAKELEMLSDFIIFAMEKSERAQKSILTDNRLVTVNKRETSYQALADSFENGEDGLYNLIANDKNIIFMPKISITAQDYIDHPELTQIQEAIKNTENSLLAATGRRKYLLRKQLIELRREQYLIKSQKNKPIYFTNLTKGISTISLDENLSITPSGEISSDCVISFLNPAHISALLCNYSKLKEDLYGRFESDAYYLMEDLDALVDAALETQYPILYDLLILKIDGLSNTEIQMRLQQLYGVSHTP